MTHATLARRSAPSDALAASLCVVGACNAHVLINGEHISPSDLARRVGVHVSVNPSTPSTRRDGRAYVEFVSVTGAHAGIIDGEDRDAAICDAIALVLIMRPLHRDLLDDPFHNPSIKAARTQLRDRLLAALHVTPTARPRLRAREAA